MSRVVHVSEERRSLKQIFRAGWSHPGRVKGWAKGSGMLSLNPDVLITQFAILPEMRPSYDLLLTVRSDPLGQRLKAVQNDRLYPGGTPLNRPLFLLFQVELAAMQIYPDRFGPYRDDHSLAVRCRQ